MPYKYDKTYNRATSEDSWMRRITMHKRLDHILREIEIENDHRILDVGCAGGMLQHLLLSHCIEVYGLDINHHTLKANSLEGKYICGDAMRIPLKNDYFDVIVCSHLLEHVPSVQGCLREMERILKPEARIVLIYPMELFRGSTCIPDVLLSGQRLSMIRKIHLHRLSLNTLKHFMKGTNLTVVTHGIIFALRPMYMTVVTKHPNHI